MNATFRLMRFNQPIGILLLLWPALIALWVASKGLPTLEMLSIFISGVLVMRAAGCVINDCTDAKFDVHVSRTQFRPLAKGDLSRRYALGVLLILLLMALALLFCLPTQTWPYGLAALIITAIYPWMKRLVRFPQLVLGVAFAFSIPMVFMSIQDELPRSAWLLFWGTVLWTVAYDTEYAKVDREDDLKLGLKSTAILFGKWDNGAILVMHLFALQCFIWAGQISAVKPTFYIGIVFATLSTIYQQFLLRQQAPKKHFAAFLNNAWWGAFVFLAFVLGK